MSLKTLWGALKERCYENPKNDLFIWFETDNISIIKVWKISRK